MKKDNRFNPKTKPFQHQLEAAKFIEGEHPVALFDEQGLGKSKEIIDGLLSDMEFGFIDGALIICKKTLLKTWENEIKKHTHLNFTNLTGEKFKRKKEFLKFSHFYLINYESLTQEEFLIKSLLKIRKLAIVLDESHRIKNPESIVTKSIFRIKDLSKKRIIITGTPVANRPEDLWAQFYFLDNGKTLGNNYAEFKKRYSIKISMGETIINETKLLELKKKIMRFSVRRTKDKIKDKLPQKIYKEYYTKLIGKQKKLYNQIKDELFAEIKKMSGEVIIDKINSIFKKMLRLIQITSNPYLIDKSYNEVPSKFKIIDKLVKEIINKNCKIIIWTSFIDNILILKRRYRNYNSLILYGGMKIKDRNKVVEWFQNDSDYKVLIANPAAAKEGLTLTAANYTIYLDRNFSSIDYIQSQDRIHRFSQTKKCYIIKIIAKETIDEYVDELITKKNQIAKLIQGDIVKIKFPKELLTKEYILKIIGGKIKNDKSKIGIFTR